MPKRYKRRRRGGKLFLLVMCLAGLGVGIWLFGKRGSDSEWNGRPGVNGS
jgi:hypothetical protein